MDVQKRPPVEIWQIFAHSVKDFGFIVMDQENRIIDWNTGAEKLLGYRREEVLGKSGDIVFVPEDRAAGAPEREIATALAEGCARDERWHLRSDGSRFRASGTLTPLNQSGATIGFAKVLTDVTVREREREQLERTLSERTALTREIQHRVKNNLQMIVSLISLQSNRISNPLMLTVLQELQMRVRTIAAVHETLYATSDFATISMGPLLNQISRNLRGIYDGENRIQLNLTAVDLALDIRDALPLALIANELIGNSLRHAFAGAGHGHVEVNLKYLDGAGAPREASLTVADDGAGLPEGVDFHSSHTLGFELMRILADQLQAKIRVTSDSHGTSFAVLFPVGAP